MHRGQLDEAIALYEEAIPLTREVYGERHPHVAVRLENLGNVYRLQGKFDQTNALLDEVLAIREEAYGKDSPLVARTRFNMGVVALQEDDFARAAKLIRLRPRRLPRGVGRAEPRLRDRAVRSGKSRGWPRRSRRGAQPLRGVARDPGRGGRTGRRVAAANAPIAGRAPTASRAHAREREQTADLALAALDRDNADHQKWIATFEKLRARCGA